MRKNIDGVFVKEGIFLTYFDQESTYYTFYLVIDVIVTTLK